ncbi:MAG TPA: transporter [Allosphingosinicella sp.]|jgi:hypothetical protein|nr:transporter [Allosphingosinicella sp.]
MQHQIAKSFAVCAVALTAAPAWGQSSEVALLQSELRQARAQIEAQQQMLQTQSARLDALEARVVQQTSVPGPVQPGATILAQGQAPEQVGEAPPQLAMPEVAVLGEMGSIVTRKGQVTGELQVDYTRADRNRALFRGIEVVESVLIGTFDINESRQDVLTASAGLRYGLSDRFEVGVRVPFVYRNDASILAPVAGTSGDPAATVDNSAKGRGIGDVEFLARYQLTTARRNLPFFIANLQVVAPTGESSFDVPRDGLGRALQAATGGGFWSVSPGVTAILPTDPAVLFGTLSYNRNFARNVDTQIPPVIVDRVDPGDSLAASVGIGVSLNQRTSFNLGYAHSWVFGTETRTRLIDPGPTDTGPVTATSRNLQIGRLLLGVTYRLDDRSSVNWSVEVGATRDAPDVRTTLRIPITFAGGR